MTTDPAASPAGGGDLRDPRGLARDLIRCPSVTPADAGALGVAGAALARLGFAVAPLRFGGADADGPDGAAPIDNLFARLGTGRPHVCFAGHTDVVPPGATDAWTAPPFGAEVRDGRLIGRGAVDMKGAVAAMVAAVARYLDRMGPPPGTISVMLTGDEEGDAVNGTRRVLAWLAETGAVPDVCLVGEPTARARPGDTVRVGRRGSLNATLTVRGTQGHVAYPERADNPLPHLVAMLAALTAEPIDQGVAPFPPTSLALTSIDVGNPARNVIPARAEARFNIRFNPSQTPRGLEAWLRRRLNAVGGAYELVVSLQGEAFVLPDTPFRRVVAAAVAEVTGAPPTLDAGGGTSDARFIKDYCPVVELGLVGTTMHQVDEQVPLADLEVLADIYARVLVRLFAAAGVEPAGPR